MNLGFLIAQIVLFLFVFGAAIYGYFVEKNGSNLPILIIGTVINIVLSCIYGWCVITAWLTIVAITGILAYYGNNASSVLACLGSYVSGTVAVLLLALVVIAYISGGKLIGPSNEIAYVEEERIEILSLADKGISDTSINGKSNLLFGTITGTTTLNYYYSYYYMKENGALDINTVSKDDAEIFPIPDIEQPYVVKKTNQYKAVDLLTGLPCEGICSGESSYVLYVPLSALPTSFTFDLD